MVAANRFAGNLRERASLYVAASGPRVFRVLVRLFVTGEGGAVIRAAFRTVRGEACGGRTARVVASPSESVETVVEQEVLFRRPRSDCAEHFVGTQMLHVKMKRHLFVRHVADCKVQASGIISRGEQKHEGASVGEARAGASVGAVEHGERNRFGEGQGFFGCLVTACSCKGHAGFRFY